jgi:hypothetical protein
LDSRILFLFLFLASVAVTPALAEEANHYLRVKTQPENLVFISGQGFYKHNEFVTLQQMPLTWQGYNFVGWKIDGAWAADNPPKIRMDSSHEAIAIFEKSDGVGGKKIVIDTIPRIAEVTVDDKIYLPTELPLSFDWEDGSEHIVILQSIVNENVNTRYVFEMWKDRETEFVRTVKAGEVKELIALYKTQHYFKPITEYSNAIGGGWYDKSSIVDFTLESEFFPDRNDDSVRYAFDSWNLGDYKNSMKNSIAIENPITVEANWRKEYKLEIRTNVPDYVPSGSGFYPQNKALALITEQELKSPNSDIKYVFDKWVSIGPNPVVISNALSPTTTITIDAPFIIEARYKKSYLVNVWSPYGTTSGGGFYNEGEVAEARVTQNEVIVEPNRVKKVFSGWNTAGASVMKFDSDVKSSADAPVPQNSNLMVIVDKPVNVTANWKTQYYLDVRSSEGTVTGAGWYNPGTLVPVSVKKPSQPAGMWSTYSFIGWSGDINPTTSMNTKVILNEPKSLVADWEVDNSPGIINGLILGGAGATGFVIFIKTKKKHKFEFGDFFKKPRYDLYREDRRGLDELMGERARADAAADGYPFAKTPRKKSFVDWLMGRDS